MDIRITPEQVSPNRYPWDAEAWIDEAARNPRTIYTALDALHLANRPKVTADLGDAMAQVTMAFPEDYAPFSHDQPRSAAGRFAMLNTIASWLRGLKVVEEEETVSTLEVPLCVFNAPSGKGAKTTFSESKTTQGTVGWKLELLGSGFGSDVTVGVTQTNTFSAAASERKLVFAPIRMRIIRAALYKRGEFQSRFLKSEAVESDERNANGIRTVTLAEWGALIGDGAVIERFDLSRDQSTDTSTYERAYELSGTFEMKLGLSAFDLKSEVTAKCAAKQTATMKFELPAGKMYEVRRPVGLAGVYFE